MAGIVATVGPLVPACFSNSMGAPRRRSARFVCRVRAMMAVAAKRAQTRHPVANG
jgi:hypothetical protein